MQQSDVVMLACPYTRETHHIANSEMLALMKPTAYLINVTRGKNVDQQALIEVLKEQRITGAGLGVFDTELLPIDNPLWEYEKCDHHPAQRRIIPASASVNSGTVLPKF